MDLIRPRSLEENLVHLAWVHAVVLLKGAVSHERRCGEHVTRNEWTFMGATYMENNLNEKHVKIAYHIYEILMLYLQHIFQDFPNFQKFSE